MTSEAPKRQKLGREAQAAAGRVVVDAMTLMGEMLAGAQKAKGVRMMGGTKGKTGGNKVEPPAVPTLSDLGLVPRTTVERWLGNNDEVVNVFLPDAVVCRVLAIVYATGRTCLPGSIVTVSCANFVNETFNS